MSALPVLTVLTEQSEDRPAHLEELTDQVLLRFTDEAGLAEAVRGAEALLLWHFLSDAVPAVWPECDRLRWIHVAAAGVDRLVFPELAASGVVVTNARGVFDRPIAEYVLGALLAHAKRSHESRDLQRRHVWAHRERASLRGSRAVVVGTGGIGREIARLLHAVGVQVTGAGRRARTGDPDFGTVVDSAELEAHVADTDYLVNAAPLTAATRGLIGGAVLAALPPRAHLVNVGRGESVDTDALVQALRAGDLDGASLDVLDTEPLPPDSPLWDLPGVVLTPHMSGDVAGWREVLARQFVDNAHRWVAGQPLRNVVDPHLGYVPGSAS